MTFNSEFYPNPSIPIELQELQKKHGDGVKISNQNKTYKFNNGRLTTKTTVFLQKNRVSTLDQFSKVWKQKSTNNCQQTCLPLGKLGKVVHNRITLKNWQRNSTKNENWKSPKYRTQWYEVEKESAIFFCYN